MFVEASTNNYTYPGTAEIEKKVSSMQEDLQLGWSKWEILGNSFPWVIILMVCFRFHCHFFVNLFDFSIALSSADGESIQRVIGWTLLGR